MHLHPEHPLHLIVIFVRSTARGHDAQLMGGCRGARRRSLLLRLEPAHQLEAFVNFIRLEFDKVQPAAYVRRVRLLREVDQFGQ